MAQADQSDVSAGVSERRLLSEVRPSRKRGQEAGGGDDPDAGGFVHVVIGSGEADHVAMSCDSQPLAEVVQVTELVVAAQLALHEQPGLLLPDNQEVNFPLFEVSNIVKFDVEA